MWDETPYLEGLERSEGSGKGVESLHGSPNRKREEDVQSKYWDRPVFRTL